MPWPLRDHFDAVKRRTAELGIRVALGADRRAVQWLIVREALLLVLLGGAIGLPLALLAARALRGLFYGIAPSDSISYATAAGVLIVVCACAAYIPAWRASRLAEGTFTSKGPCAKSSE